MVSLQGIKESSLIGLEQTKDLGVLFPDYFREADGSFGDSISKDHIHDSKLFVVDPIYSRELLGTGLGIGGGYIVASTRDALHKTLVQTSAPYALIKLPGGKAVSKEIAYAINFFKEHPDVKPIIGTVYGTLKAGTMPEPHHIQAILPGLEEYVHIKPFLRLRCQMILAEDIETAMSYLQRIATTFDQNCEKIIKQFERVLVQSHLDGIDPYKDILHYKRETLRDAAIRETIEETGFILNPEQTPFALSTEIKYPKSSYHPLSETVPTPKYRAFFRGVIADGQESDPSLIVHSGSEKDQELQNEYIALEKLIRMGAANAYYKLDRPLCEELSQFTPKGMNKEYAHKKIDGLQAARSALKEYQKRYFM